MKPFDQESGSFSVRWRLMKRISAFISNFLDNVHAIRVSRSPSSQGLKTLFSSKAALIDLEEYLYSQSEMKL